MKRGEIRLYKNKNLAYLPVALIIICTNICMIFRQDRWIVAVYKAEVIIKVLKERKKHILGFEFLNVKMTLLKISYSK